MKLQGPALCALEPDYQTLIELFSYSFTRYPDLPAFSYAGVVYTYRDINRLSRNFAAFIQNQTDLQPGDRIVVQLPNIVQFPVVAIGALRAGLVLVNSNPLYSYAEQQHLYTDSGARALVLLAEDALGVAPLIADTAIAHCLLVREGDLLGFPRNLLQNLKQSRRRSRQLNAACRIDCAKLLSAALSKGARLKYHSPPVLPEQMALLQYTAGTGGKPRGVMLSHRNLIANVQQIKQMFSGRVEVGKEIAIVPLPLYHIYSFTLNMLVLQEAGAHRVLIRDAGDVNTILNEMFRWPFTLFSGLNSLFLALCRTPELQALNFTTLKLSISGGVPLNDTVMNSWKLITGCGIIDGYGLTEASPVVAVNLSPASRALSVGAPLPGTTVMVVDAQGEELPEGEAGELLVKGPQVMRGYWRDEAGSRAVLTADGWLATGDIARLNHNGSITLIDRKSDVIHVSGFSIYPSELESIIGSHPGVQECAVIGVPDDATGEQVKAYIVPASSRLSVKTLREYCRERMTSYKVPHRVEFCRSLPRSSIGKVQRRNLREQQALKVERQVH